MTIKYPKVHTDNNDLVFISFYINNKRYRLYNGNRIGTQTNPNSFPIKDRVKIGNILAAETYKYLAEGGKLQAYRKSDLVSGSLNEKETIYLALTKKKEEAHSKKYNRILDYSYCIISRAFIGDSLSSELLIKELNKFTHNTTFNTVRRHINVILNKAVELGLESNPLRLVRAKRTKAKLHKPFTNLREVLDEVKAYNHNLYLCCLMTYGCLLRPHRELTWGDFSEDLSQINLSGDRNKSGKNRIVPVPYYVQEELLKKNKDLNIFTGTTQPYSEDYFKGLWTKFKKRSKTLEPGQTLYSFRHSGAIEIFKRTGSIHKLQRAMGHSSLNVSLTYLRELEVAELNEEDMPMYL
jgi:integrase